VDQLKIARVKLSGFKSFVDPIELRVMAGLTGVVGPNGCGKSNLLEAIRWAMGEGSPKSLRGGAMEDVIFAGTATRPQRQFAEVSILAERENDEVEVTRRIERGAGSAYRINGRDARARDAQLLFADAATGAHSPALVSQGKIGAIIAVMLIWGINNAAAKIATEDTGVPGIAAIRHAVAAAGGNISEASKQLGISRNTIYRKLRWNKPA
jgi:energy-coupling factor transporter ATP-binding protein EcfA2